MIFISINSKMQTFLNEKGEDYNIQMVDCVKNMLLVECEKSTHTKKKKKKDEKRNGWGSKCTVEKRVGPMMWTQIQVKWRN